MSDNLYEFAWRVPTTGHRTITTYDTRKTQKESRTYLTEEIPRGGKIEYRTTRPLTTLRGQLHRLFADLEPTETAIVDFADRHGRLGGDVQATIPVEPNPAGGGIVGFGDELRKWTAEIFALNDAVTLWDLAKQHDTEALAAHIVWDEVSVEARFEDDRHFDRRVLANRDDPNQRALFESLEPGDLIGPAMLAVEQIVNKHLWGKRRVSTKMSWNAARQSMEQHFMPTCLIGCIWLDFMLAATGNIEYRRCAHCGTAFEVSIRGKRKLYCSNACRVAHHKAKHAMRADG